jgi:hypothetical protein
MKSSRTNRAVVIALLLAACSGNDSTAPTPTTAPLTRADAQAVGEELEGEVQGITTGASLFHLLSPVFLQPPGAFGMVAGPTGFSPPPNCPTLSESPPTDQDGDHIPDDLTLTFDPADCTFGTLHGHAFAELSGSIHIVDPSQTDPGIRLGWNAFQSKFVVDDTLFWQRRVDGVWQLLASAAGFSGTDSTTVTHESSQRPPATLAKAWQVDFAAATGQTFVPGQPLPGGDLTVDGKTTRTRGSESRVFMVATTTPLHYDAACAADQKIVSGELTATTTTSQGTATVTVQFNGCGVRPTVTLVSAPMT